MQLLQKLDDKRILKSLCLTTSILGAAILCTPSKAQAKDPDFSRFQRTGFSSNNLGSNLVAEEVSYKPYEVAQAESIIQNDGFVFDGSKPAPVKAESLLPPVPVKIQAIRSNSATLDLDDIFHNEFGQDFMGFSQEENPHELKTIETLEVQPFNNLQQEAKILEDDEEEFSENYLLLKITSGIYVINQGMSAYEVESQLYISLYELVETVDFPIEVFDEEQRAEGWFIEPDNSFYLDSANEELVISGSNREFNPKDIKIIDEEMYLSSEALSNWFGLKFELNFSTLTLDIESNEKLAFEQKIDREKKWEKSNRKTKRERKVYPKIELPYKFAEIPSTTVLLNNNYANTQGKSTITKSYSIQGSGDLFNMSSDFFISGTDEEDIVDTRLRLYRYDNDGVFEGTDIKQFEIGDITPARLNLAGGGGVERGVKVTNRALGTVSTPDNVIIEGEVEPGWEVELYRNNEFVSFISDTSNGRYEFEGLSLEGGMNLFRIVKYGPFGETEEEYQRYFIGAGMLKQGELNYEISASQANLDLLPNTVSDYEFSGVQRVIANAEYGITEDFSVGAGLFSGPLLEEIRNGILLSSRASVLGTYNRVDYLLNDDGTSITSLSNRISLGDFNVSAFATLNNGFDSAEIDSTLNSSLDVTSSMNVFGLLDLNLRLGTEYETFQSDRTRIAYNNQISTTIGGFALSNKLDWDIVETSGNETETVTGEFFFRKRIDDIIFDTDHEFLFRTNLNYTVEPNKELDSMNVRLEKSIDRDLRLRLNVDHSFGTNKMTTYNLGTNYNHEYFSTSFNVGYDSEGDSSASLNLRFNVGPDYEDSGIGFIKNETAQRGTVSAFAYLDENINGKFDADDIPLEGIRFKSRFGNKGTTNESGVAIMTGFSGYKTDDIYIDNVSLPDIFYVPINDGFTVVPRPGNTSNLEFPIVLGGEIDGIIEFEDETLNRRFDFSKFNLELINKNGKTIKEITADQTGYYLFEQIIPGNYKIKLKPLLGSNQEYLGETEIPIKIDPEDPVVSGINFMGNLSFKFDTEDGFIDSKIFYEDLDLYDY